MLCRITRRLFELSLRNHFLYWYVMLTIIAVAVIGCGTSRLPSADTDDVAFVYVNVIPMDKEHVLLDRHTYGQRARAVGSNGNCSRRPKKHARPFWMPARQDTIR